MCGAWCRARDIKLEMPSVVTKQISSSQCPVFPTLAPMVPSSGPYTGTLEPMVPSPVSRQRNWSQSVHCCCHWPGLVLSWGHSSKHLHNVKLHSTVYYLHTFLIHFLSCEFKCLHVLHPVPWHANYFVVTSSNDIKDTI